MKTKKGDPRVAGVLLAFGAFMWMMVLRMGAGSPPREPALEQWRKQAAAIFDPGLAREGVLRAYQR